MDTPVEVDATINANLYVVCPECKFEFDLFEYDNDASIATNVFNEDWTGLKELDFECPRCSLALVIRDLIW